MSIYVYATQNCKETAATYGFSEELIRFIDRVEHAQSLSLFDKDFPPPFLVKRKFAKRQGRLIAKDIRLSIAPEDVIVVLLAVMIRGNADYNRQFGKNPEGYADRHLADLYDEDEILEWLIERKEAPVIEKNRPSEVETEFLYAASSAATTEEDWTIAESAEWFQQSKEEFIKARHSLILKAVESIASKVRMDAEPVSGTTSIDKDWHVEWSSFPATRLLVLKKVAPGSSDTSESEPLGIQDASEMLKKCRRAYFDIITANEDAWLDIQNDSKGNLALSPEEQDVLHSVKSGGGQAFPLFINGRAGSGKSTILQYLFADYLMKYLEDLSTGRIQVQPKDQAGSFPHSGPVYFTCSKELLDKALATVDQLLKFGAQFWHKEERKNIVNSSRAEIRKSFCELRAYLLHLLPQESRDKFPAAGYVSYSLFRRMWEDHFAKQSNKRGLSAALSWHVIRTHIKGASADLLLDPEEYELLEKKQRTVTQETYENVFQYVWDRWYRQLCEGELLWDDQDLARHLLETDIGLPRFWGIFCDEAQDFTSVELALILKLSLFSDRKLEGQEAQRVPFVFAGDQFQTLNPTGFRWDAVKANFYKHFIFSLNPYGHSDANLNYQELAQNYRSSRNIVNFSNLIQAQRSRLLDIRQIKPQETWQDNDSNEPIYWFSKDDEKFWREFAQQKDLVVIVPCAEGEEAAYVEKHLKGRINIVDGVPENVWSAARAKGLEFPRIIIFGFGSELEASKLIEMASNNTTSSGNERDAILPLEYYFNGLYVAVTRAMRSLFVVDDRKAISGFWGFASSYSLESVAKGAPGGEERWINHLCQMTEGLPEHLGTSFDYEARRVAQGYENQGTTSESGYLLKQAAIHYRNAGDIGGADRCSAWADFYDGQFLQAGHRFVDQQRWSDCIRCYWMAGNEGRRKLIEISKQVQDVRESLQAQVATRLSEKLHLPVLINLLDEMVREARSKSDSWRVQERKAWNDAVVQVIQRIGDINRNAAAPEDWLRANMVVRDVFKHNLCAADGIFLGRMLARAGNYAEARREFDKQAKNSEQLEAIVEYIETRLETDDYPENIKWMAKLHNDSRICAEYESNSKKTPEDTTLKRHLAYALKKNGKLQEASDIFAELSDPDPLIEIADLMKDTRYLRNSETRSLNYGRALILLALTGQYRVIMSFLGKRNQVPSKYELMSAWFDENQVDFSQILLVACACGSPFGHLQDKEMIVLAEHVLKCVTSSGYDESFLVLQGTALERTGRLNPARDFYESRQAELLRSNDLEKRHWVLERLFKVRWKLADLDQRKNPEAAASDKMLIARDLEKYKLRPVESVPDLPDAISRDAALNILAALATPKEIVSDSTEQEPPTPGPVAAPPVRPNLIEVEVAGIQFKLRALQQRLNLEHLQSGAQAAFLYRENTVTGEGNFEKLGAKWQSAQWNVVIQLLKKGSQDRVVVRYQSLPIELHFDLNRTA